MSNILARLQNPANDELVKERESERQWRWILLKFKPSLILSDASLIRSLASNWSHFNKSKSIHPSGYRLQDLPEIVDVFSEYLEQKKKSFIQKDIQCFVAWKIWEAKADCGNVISGELFTPVLKWVALMTYEMEAYKALSRIERRRDEKVIQAIAELLGIASVTPEQEKELKALLSNDRQPFFDAIAGTMSNSIDRILGIQQSQITSNEQQQIKGSEEE